MPCFDDTSSASCLASRWYSKLTTGSGEITRCARAKDVSRNKEVQRTSTAERVLTRLKPGLKVRGGRVGNC